MPAGPPPTTQQLVFSGEVAEVGEFVVIVKGMAIKRWEIYYHIKKKEAGVLKCGK